MSFKWAVCPLPCMWYPYRHYEEAQQRLVCITALSSELACHQQSQIDTLRAVSCSTLRRAGGHHWIKAMLLGTRTTFSRNLPVLFIHWRLSEIKPGFIIRIILSILPKTKSIKLHLFEYWIGRCFPTVIRGPLLLCRSLSTDSFSRS
jgi:hypothetical protein